MKNKSTQMRYSPKLNSWFSTELVYEGKGVASFNTLIGKVKGKTIISINELGDLRVIMQSERLITKIQVNGVSEGWRIHKFLYCQPKGVYIGIGENNKNYCSNLTVTTQNGIFKSAGQIYWTTDLLKDEIIFWISKGTFEGIQKNKPKYWVLPLTNFISRFSLNLKPSLIQHPLRMYTTPVIPHIRDKQKRGEAFLFANSRNNLIGFDYDGKTGFIEGLPDYNERKEKLKSGAARQTITALMVGEINKDITSEWFPYELANLLSIASGSEVGVPWLELRDKRGKLLSRKHFPIAKTAYTKGYAAIEDIHNGVGELISVASISPEFHKPYFRILINQLTQLISQNHLENRMTILSRTFEGLFENHSARKEILIANLPNSYKIEMRSILKGAKDEIEKLYHKSRKEKLDEKAVYSIERTKKNLENASNTDGDFSFKVLYLLDLHKMPDAKIMESYYSTIYKGKMRSWAGFLSRIRNAPIHFGYFALQNGTYDHNEIINTQDHMHDMLIRIALKTISYKGEYQPKVVDELVDGKTVDWVNENSISKGLGYERRRLP